MARRLTAVALLAVLAGCNGTPRRQAFRGIPQSGPLSEAAGAFLRVVNPDRKTTLDGDIVLDFRIANRSDQLAVVYNELAPGWLVVIEVVGSNGVYARSPAEDLRKGQAGRYHYAALPPGSFVGRQYVIRPKDPRWELPPGRYRVRVVYNNDYELCVASPCFTDEDIERLKEKAVVPLLTGRIVSNVETFRIVDR